MTAMTPPPAFVPQPGDDRLTTAMLSDSLDAAGVRGSVLHRRLPPVRPGMRAFGRAATVRFVPTLDADPETPYDDAIAFIDSLGPGEVAVIATDGDNRTAYWGELFSAAAAGAGATGVVCDSNLRDVEKIAAIGFAAFGASTRPIDFRGRMRIAGMRTSVVMCGVEVCDGDLVLADEDGVVVVPRAVEDDVLARARARASAESTVLTELLGGASLSEVWRRHGVL